MDRLLTEFMNLLFFQRATGPGKAKNCWQASSFSFQLFRSWRGIDLLEASEPKGWRKALLSFSRRPLPPGVWSALAVEMCRIGGTLAAVLTWSCSTPISDQGKCCQPVPREAKLEKQTTGSVSTQNRWMGPVFERLQRRQPQDKHLLNLNYAEYLLLFHRAAANLQVDMVPYQALQWTEPNTCERWNPHKNEDDGNQPSLCAATSKADVSTNVGQSSLHWSRTIASTATTSCPQCCFMVPPLRHRLDSSVFCDRSLQCKHRIATVFS